MIKVNTVSHVSFECILSEKDEKKVLDSIKRRKEKMPFMSEKKMIEHVVEKLDEYGEIELYNNSEETHFSTYEIEFCETEEISAKGILEQGGIL